MSRYRLELRPSVEKTLRKIRDVKLQRRLDDALNKLAENPRCAGAEKMAGGESRYRFRVGDYRIIYDDSRCGFAGADRGDRGPQGDLPKLKMVLEGL